MNAEGITSLMGLLPFGYLLSLPVYWALHKLLQKFAGLDASFWKLSVVAFVAALIPDYLAVLAWGGDGTPPPVSTALMYILLGAIAFTVIYWLGAKLLGITISVAGAIITFFCAITILLLMVFMTRSGS